MNSNDLILHFVDMYIAEREKNINLQYKIKQQEQNVDEKEVKTDIQ